MGDHDQWRHVRAALAARTPGSELLGHRHGGEIVAGVGGKAAPVMVMWVPMGVPQARADADLDALSTLWNVAGELLDDADALAGEWATVARLRALLRRCAPFLGGYQCEGQTEGDALIALEADIAAELGPEREGASA